MIFPRLLIPIQKCKQIFLHLFEWLFNNKLPFQSATLEVLTPIKASAIIGRRIRSDDYIALADGTNGVSFKAFIDKRYETDLSFDAMGYSGSVENKVKRHIQNILKKHNELNNESYIGWTGIKIKSIPTHKVYSTPVTEIENPDNPNPHHCTLDRSNFRNSHAARALAHELMIYANTEKLIVTIDD